MTAPWRSSSAGHGRRDPEAVVLSDRCAGERVSGAGRRGRPIAGYCPRSRRLVEAEIAEERRQTWTMAPAHIRADVRMDRGPWRAGSSPRPWITEGGRSPDRPVGNALQSHKAERREKVLKSLAEFGAVNGTTFALQGLRIARPSRGPNPKCRGVGGPSTKRAVRGSGRRRQTGGGGAAGGARDGMQVLDFCAGARAGRQDAGARRPPWDGKWAGSRDPDSERKPFGADLRAGKKGGRRQQKRRSPPRGHVDRQHRRTHGRGPRRSRNAGERNLAPTARRQVANDRTRWVNRTGEQALIRLCGRLREGGRAPGFYVTARCWPDENEGPGGQRSPRRIPNSKS